MRLDSYSCLANSSTTKRKVCQMSSMASLQSLAASPVDRGRTCPHLNSYVWGAMTRRTASTLMAAICLAAGGLVQAQAVMGTLACDASLVQPPEPAFSVPASIRIEGNALTWTREAIGMREVVSAPVVNGVAVLDGYGGSVSANTRQAFWDWRVQGRLNVTTDGVAGDVRLLSKDGRTVQRRCTFASAGRAAPLPASAAQAAPAQASTPVPVPTPLPPPLPPTTVPPAAPVQASPAPMQPSVVPDADRAAKEEELRAREAALARREQSVLRRERALTQAPKPVAPPPAPKAAQPAAPAPGPISAPAAPAKPLSPTALGDI